MFTSLESDVVSLVNLPSLSVFPFFVAKVSKASEFCKSWMFLKSFA